MFALARPLERPRRSPKSYSSWVPEIRLTSPATTSRRKNSRLPTVTAEVLGQPQLQHLQYRLRTVADHRHHSQRLLDGLRLAPVAALWPTPLQPSALILSRTRSMTSVPVTMRMTSLGIAAS